jgi:hypothetical protein
MAQQRLPAHVKLRKDCTVALRRFAWPPDVHL